MPIEHVFILMLENRSFDHLFGFSPISGTDAATGQPTTVNRPDPAVDINQTTGGDPFPVHDGADFSLKDLDPDPGHEFADVRDQLAGGMLGFVKSYADQKDSQTGLNTSHPGRVM